MGIKFLVWSLNPSTSVKTLLYIKTVLSGSLYGDCSDTLTSGLLLFILDIRENLNFGEANVGSSRENVMFCNNFAI